MVMAAGNPHRHNYIFARFLSCDLAHLQFQLSIKCSVTFQSPGQSHVLATTSILLRIEVKAQRSIQRPYPKSISYVAIVIRYWKLSHFCETSDIGRSQLPTSQHGTLQKCFHYRAIGRLYK